MRQCWDCPAVEVRLENQWAQATDFVEAAKAEEVFDEEVYEKETVSAAGAEVGTVVSTDRKLIGKRCR